MNRKPSVIIHANLSPAVLLGLAILSFIVFEILTQAKFGTAFVVIPDVMFLVLLTDSIVTKIRNNTRGAFEGEAIPDLGVYDQIIERLNELKHSDKTVHNKKQLSEEIISSSQLTEDEKSDLRQQVNGIYGGLSKE
jgi:hypothetical protein